MGEICARQRVGGNFKNNFISNLQQQRQNFRNEFNRDYIKID